MNMNCPYCGSEKIDTGGRCANCGQFFKFVNAADVGITPNDSTDPGYFKGIKRSRRIHINRPVEGV